MKPFDASPEDPARRVATPKRRKRAENLKREKAGRAGALVSGNWVEERKRFYELLDEGYEALSYARELFGEDRREVRAFNAIVAVQCLEEARKIDPETFDAVTEACWALACALRMSGAGERAFEKALDRLARAEFRDVENHPGWMEVRASRAPSTASGRPVANRDATEALRDRPDTDLAGVIASIEALATDAALREIARHLRSSEAFAAKTGTPEDEKSP